MKGKGGWVVTFPQYKGTCANTAAVKHGRECYCAASNNHVEFMVLSHAGNKANHFTQKLSLVWQRECRWPHTLRDHSANGHKALVQPVSWKDIISTSGFSQECIHDNQHLKEKHAHIHIQFATWKGFYSCSSGSRVRNINTVQRCFILYDKLL